MKKVKVTIPIAYMHTTVKLKNTSEMPDWPIVTEHRFVIPTFAKLLKDRKISFDTRRGIMFFRTEEEAALFKLSHT